ncbi:unnamed protein product [Caenorhabditis sp. 36 PRJEB53466]|nr:unnamed protein product [Caenorhabditis sp. 36 PRJEB53466]
MPQLYSLFLLLLLFASTCHAGPTILITGSTTQNAAKEQFLGDYVPQSVVKNAQSTRKNIVVFHREELDNVHGVLTRRIEQFGGVQIDKNVSTIVYTKTKYDSLNSEELEALEVLLRTERSLYVVDFDSGNEPSWTDVADCWATSSVASDSSNTVYFCNKKDALPPFSLKTAQIPIEKKVFTPIASSFFVSAANKKYRVDKKKMEEELEDEIQDIVDETMKTVERRKKNKNDEDDDDDDEDENEFDNKHDPKRDHRLHCKYRKTCYETGKRGLIEPYDFSIDHLFHFWRAPASQQHHLPKTEDADQDGVPDSEDDDVNLADRKLVCKYRTTCYKEHDIPLSDKQQEKERSFISAKLQAPQGKKRTLKDIAEKAVSKVKEREEEVKTRPLPNSLIVEKKLQAIEDQLQKKVGCKYRKSCYETGELPDIDDSSFTFKIPFLSSGDDDDDDDDEKEEKSFGEMEDLEKKHYCKYRKSCYETGEKPEIENELVVESFHDILDVPNIVETRKLTVQERCKYRKSCYKTGVLPDLSQDDEHIEKVANKEVSSIVPSTVQDLKTLCKYRKSCYQEIIEAPSVDTVQSIRKRRLIEKEVRKRRTRRHRRLHKRRAMMSRYGMTSGPSSKYEKVEKTQKELQDIADARESRKDVLAPKSIKIQVKKKEKASKIVQEAPEAPEADEDDDKEPEPEPEPVKKNKKSSKKEPEPEPEPEEDPKPEPVKKSKKSSKKVKEPEPAPEPEEEEEPVVVAVPVPVNLSSKKSKRSLKKAKEPEPEDEPEPAVEYEPESEKEAEQEPEPEPVKKNKKSSKKAKEPEPEPEQEPEPPVKVEKIYKESAEPEFVEKSREKEDDDDDDDDDNEFDNKHDPKRDHRLHCKYRKTCYETGERGLIEPYDFSLWHLVHFWAAPPSQQHHNYGKHKDSDGDGIPDLEDKDTAMSYRKLSCKYRPSCYEQYGLPVDEKVLEREQKRTVKDDSAKDDNDDDDDDDDDKERKIFLSAADRRLECKYRRSCYDSGVLPSIQQWSEAPALFETIEISSKNLKMEKCKYRKSCYEAAGLNDKEAEVTEEEELKKPHLKEKLKPVEPPTERHHHSKHGKKKHQEPKESEEDDDDDENEELEEKPKKNKEERKEEAAVHKQTDQETLEQEHKELHLSTAEKSWCKYRKSCYSSVEPSAAKQDHSGTMARRAGSGQKCHIYYLSCRETMGLPPKEKAPMGPKGKRLCRKKKTD